MNGTAEPRSVRRYGLGENGRIFMLMDDQPDSAGHFANLEDHREALRERDEARAEVERLRSEVAEVRAAESRAWACHKVAEARGALLADALLALVVGRRSPAEWTAAVDALRKVGRLP